MYLKPSNKYNYKITMIDPGKASVLVNLNTPIIFILVKNNKRWAIEDSHIPVD